MKKLIFMFPLIMMSFTSNAQNSDKFTGSLLWKISGNGLEKPSYIFGTHHLINISFIQDYPGFNEALESAGQIVGEIEMSEMLSSQRAMMKHAAMPAYTTYESLLTQDEYQSLDELLHTHLGAGLQQFERFKPAMITQMLTTKQIQEATPDLNPLTHISIDQHIQDIAKAKGKNTKGLETVNDQIQAFFYADPLNVQAKSLLCALSSLEYTQDSIHELTKLYLEGNLFEIYKLAFDDPKNPCQLSAEWTQAINKNRNEKWMCQLPGLFADSPAFVAVGVLHLCGEEGLLYQLDQLGYTVEPVTR